jgi:hypothetical protein
MDKHALAILGAAEPWDWYPALSIQSSGEEAKCCKFTAITAKLLAGFITESQVLGGTLLDQFWVVFGKCHFKFNENSRSRSFL